MNIFGKTAACSMLLIMNAVGTTVLNYNDGNL